MERRLKVFYTNPDQLVALFFKRDPPQSSGKFIHHALYLTGVSEGWTVQYVGWSDMRACMMVVVHHPDFPVVPDGQILDEIQLVIIQTITNQDGIILERATFEGRNFPSAKPGWREHPLL